MKRTTLTGSTLICLALLGLAGCNWRDVSPDDERLGQALRVERDPDAPGGPPLNWTTCLVLRNSGDSAPVAFRTTGQKPVAKVYKRGDTPTGGLVALRVGPEDVEFMFYSSANHPAPEQVQRLVCNEVVRQYPELPIFSD